MCVDVASGMAFLETALIAHRDLAARNVLLTAGMQCKVELRQPSLALTPVQTLLGKRAWFAAHNIKLNIEHSIKHNLEHSVAHNTAHNIAHDIAHDALVCWRPTLCATARALGWFVTVCCERVPVPPRLPTLA